MIFDICEYQSISFCQAWDISGELQSSGGSSKMGPGQNILPDLRWSWWADPCCEIHSETQSRSQWKTCSYILQINSFSKTKILFIIIWFTCLSSITFVTDIQAESSNLPSPIYFLLITLLRYYSQSKVTCLPQFVTGYKSRYMQWHFSYQVSPFNVFTYSDASLGFLAQFWDGYSPFSLCDPCGFAHIHILLKHDQILGSGSRRVWNLDFAIKHKQKPGKKLKQWMQRFF